MKLTIIANYGHGSFGSGDRHLTRQEHLQSWLSKRDQAYYETIADEISLDRGQLGLDTEGARLCMSDFLEANSIKTRGGFVIW